MLTEESLPTIFLAAWFAPLVALGLSLLYGCVSSNTTSAGASQRSTGAATAGLAIAAVALSFVLSLTAMWIWTSNPAAHGETHAGHERSFSGALYTWADLGTQSNPGGVLSVGWYINGLTVTMFPVVTCVALCVFVYSLGYMDVERSPVTDPLAPLRGGGPLTRPGRLGRFYQFLLAFLFSMLGIVIAGSLAMVFVFWELVGLCSYLLIGFYFERPAASAAANKAFLANRVGDVGLLIALAVLWSAAGTLEFQTTGPSGEPAGLLASETVLTKQAYRPIEGLPCGALTLAGLGIFCACVGKSAQFPLHVWLPEAMEGPTPVSALVHSATMVAAGVFLLARVAPLLTPTVLLTVAYVGAGTLLMGACGALCAGELKRLLAYSTISQLGFMMLGIGLGGLSAHGAAIDGVLSSHSASHAGVFHLTTHAFFKALLFLGAGAVIHATHTGQLNRLGGLRLSMPWTACLFGVGCIALAGLGIPGTAVGSSGFYSKDAILSEALRWTSNHPEHRLLIALPLLGAALTACYAARMWWRIFATTTPSEAVVADSNAHPHDPPWSMRAPMLFLAVLALVGGAFGLHLDHSAAEEAFHALAELLATAAAVLGLLVGGVTLWLRKRGRGAGDSPLAGWFDWAVLTAVPRAGARSALFLAEMVGGGLDKGLIDGSLRGGGRGVWVGAGRLSRAQSGSIRTYLGTLVLTVVMVFLGVAVWRSAGYGM